jgi:hypothetical protein
MTTQEDGDHNPAAILAKRSQGAKAQLPRSACLLGMREESAESGASIAKRVHDRASGASCKARVVAFPCFRPVPACYRRQGEPTKEAPAARISAFDPMA